MDPLDERLRKAMKALDDQVSDRYFEELPTRTLVRLEEQMQSDVNRRSGSPNSPLGTPKPERQEDSGLHDMRALAQTTKQRMSARRIPTQNPPVDDAALRASSASLRAIALPDPDKMVQLDSAPIVGNGTGPAPLLDRARSESGATAGTATAAERPAPITPMKRKSKAPLVVASSLVVAAAAGVVGFVVLKKDAAQKDSAPAATTAAPGAMAEKKNMTVEPASAPMTPPPAPLEAQSAPVGGASGAAASAAIATDGIVADEKAEEGLKEAEKADRTSVGRDKGKGDDKHDRKDKDSDKVKAPGGGEKTDTKDTKTGPTSNADPNTTKKDGAGDKQEQSLDDLLRDAGVDPNAKKKDEGPKLDKKGLDAGDIRKAMSALNSKAQGCYAKYSVGGSVGVKLSVAPSGEVKSAKATGSFAGTPTGDCVANVASSAKFPPWDGGPATVSFSYFLSE